MVEQLQVNRSGVRVSAVYLIKRIEVKTKDNIFMKQAVNIFNVGPN